MAKSASASEGAGSADARGRVAEPHALREEGRLGPSDRVPETQHAKGNLTAREYIELLLNPGSFNEVERQGRHCATGFGGVYQRNTRASGASRRPR